jgi:uncharacterized protein YqhQ
MKSNFFSFDNWLERVIKTSVVVGILAGVLWAAIDWRIKIKQEPIVEILTYHTFIFEAQLDSTVARVAAERYKRWKDGVGGLR